MAETRHVKMKIGDAEFEADVPADSVQAMYDQFLTAIQRSVGPATPPVKEKQAQEPEPERGSENAPAPDSEIISRIFEQRQDGVITLRRLPKSDERDADALTLILYGYRRLKQMQEVLATQLLSAAQYAGMKAYRPAHALSAYEQEGLVIRGGVKKGSWYGLTNQGIAKAEEVLRKMSE